MGMAGEARPNMAIALLLGHWMSLIVLSLVCTAFGHVLLRWIGVQSRSRLETILYAGGLGFGVLAWALFTLGMVGTLTKQVVLLLLVGMALGAGRDWLFLKDFMGLARNGFIALKGAPFQAVVFCCIVGFLLLDALMAMAPLTGSDAMHYHFTVPYVWAQAHRIIPVFWTTWSFFTGQGHLFIALGLVLGSDQFALGLIYLGGVFTLAATFAFARRLLPLRWALLAGLAFLLTPIIYWQISVAGAPDIWIAFYTTLAVILVTDALAQTDNRRLLLAGLFAGFAASSKYPAWSIPLVLAVLVGFFTRSWRSVLLVAAPAVGTGVYPHVRNLVFTGDPFFPFFMAWIAPMDYNPYTWQSVLGSTGARTFQLGVKPLVAYPFFMVFQGERFGAGHYFGPLILSFTPFMLFVWRWHNIYRVALLFAISVFVVNTLTNQIARFLLPIFPVMLVLALTGLEEATKRGWWLTAVPGRAALALFLLVGGTSNLLYAKDFIPAALGLEARETFLARMAPNYQVAAFVNKALAARPGKVLVFFRHLYYLRVPFINGNPDTSWIMNPQRYGSPEALMHLLQSMGVRYVVKAPGYPTPLQDAFERLERNGVLQPFAYTSVEDFVGPRVHREKERLPVTITRVAETR